MFDMAFTPESPIFQNKNAAPYILVDFCQMHDKRIVLLNDGFLLERKYPRNLYHLSLRKVLNCISSAILPVAVAVHTVITTHMEKKRTDELRQQQIYDHFLDSIYQLHLDQELNETSEPWAFANTRYQSAHRQWDLIRKLQSIQFMQEKELIGRHEINKHTGEHIRCLPDIVRLFKLNFDRIRFESSSKGVYNLNLTCIRFTLVSLVGSEFSNVDLSFAWFDGSRLDGVFFNDVLLTNAHFSQSSLVGTNFGNSNLTGAHFADLDLSETIISDDQIKQATFHNVTMRNGTRVMVTPVQTTISSRMTDIIYFYFSLSLIF